ncbi:MAG TPA: chloride channel protein [Sphingomicrobium sp.]|nr:chloride channel protein [Sphingomicrobium sp.]
MASTSLYHPRRLADYSADYRMLLLAAMAVVAGTGGAFSAWALLKLIALATNVFWYGNFSFAQGTIVQRSPLLVLLIPIIGGLIIGLMARFGSEKIRGHGIPEAIETILFGESKLSLKVALLKPLSSAVSIGSGGPFGAEGPIIMTGGAIGSLFAQLFRLSAAERKTLLVAGATAGMTGIFGTPFASIMLAVELLLFEWKPRSFVPVVTAVLVSLAWRPLLVGSGPLFPFAAPTPIGIEPVAISAGLGLITGLEAAVLSFLLYRIEDGFHRLPIHWMWWPAIGAVAVGVGGLFDLRVLGAGYGLIQSLLDGNLLVKAVVLLLVVKAVVWLVALGSGTSGGILAPLLILGGCAGFLIGQYLPGDPGFWAMIGMAGVMSGTMRAPMTGALFAAELTNHLSALPETIAAGATAYAISVLIMKRSILTEKIARRGRHILREYTVDALEFLLAGQLMTRNPKTLPASMAIPDVLRFFTEEAEHRSYPVVDAEGRLVGLVSRTDALRWQVEKKKEGQLGDLLSDASTLVAHPDTPCGAVADMMVDSGTGRVPIVDPQTRRVVGLISRQDLLKVRTTQRRGEMVRPGRKRRKGRLAREAIS